MSGQSFPQDVVAGTQLVVPSIHSPNYITEVSGWTINLDGSAEFNNLTIRGTFSGTNFIINSSGAFFYSPSEGAGNLIVSIATSAGSDSFGNTYPKGINVTTGTISGTSISAGTISGTTISGGSVSGTTISGGTISGTTISGTTFDGTDFIMNGSGMFLYSGTPGSGDMTVSIASTSGTDSFGNTYQSGVTSYSGSTYAALNDAGIELSSGSPSNPATVTAFGAGEAIFQSGDVSSGDTSAGVSVQSADANGGTSNISLVAGTVTATGAISASGAISGNTLSSTGNITAGNNLGVDGGTVFVGTGGASITASNFNMVPQMGVPANYPLTTSGGTTQVNNACACLNQLIGELINRGMIA